MTADVLSRATPSRPPLPAQVRRHAEAALRLASALAAVDEAMVSPPAGRASFALASALGVKDPVGETVASVDRLTLARRAAEAELMLERTAQALEGSLRTLEGAVAQWEGDRR